MTISIPAWTNRNDLAILKFTRPNLIGTKLLPTLTFSKKVDVLVYTPVRNDALTAQTGRSMGAAFALNNIDNVRQAIDMSAAEIAFTDTKDLSDVSEMGDLENSMRQLAYNGKPVVAYMLEAKIAKAFLDGKVATASATDKAMINNIREKRQAISAKCGDGMIVAAMSQSTYNTIIMMDEIQKQIGKAVTMPYGTGLTAANIARVQLAAIFGVDEVLIGQNRAWEADTIVAKGGIVVAQIAEPGVDPRFQVQLGRTACFVDYVSEPTPADGNMGKDDYDEAMMVAGPGGNKQYATPFVCSMWTYGQGGAVALTVQSFSLPYIFNADLYEVIALPVTASI